MLLIDMEMPESCSKCRLMETTGFCKALGGQVSNVNKCMDTRYKNCPLKNENVVSEQTYTNEYLLRKEAEQKLYEYKNNSVLIPEGATNGEVLCNIFPCNFNVVNEIVYASVDDGTRFSKNWWDAIYKKEC